MTNAAGFRISWGLVRKINELSGDTLYAADMGKGYRLERHTVTDGRLSLVVIRDTLPLADHITDLRLRLQNVEG